MGPDDEDAGGSADPADLGPPPAVADRDRIRAAARARLFGAGSASALPDPLVDSTQTIPGGDGTQPSSRRSNDTVAPDRLGRFEVLARIGRGGMGEVYEAYDPELDRKVALKVLRPELRSDASGDAGSARLLREAQAMARLVDPHVITVHDVGTFGDRVFVAMELVEGQTLRRWLEARPPWTEVLSAFLRAGAGLAAAHRAGLVHRDFKPDNVLMGEDGRIRVVDFGLARAIVAEESTEPSSERRSEHPRPDQAIDPLHTPLTQSGTIMGTPAYMAPEQHLGRPADARSDQFSFCVALWEGLYGRRPFSGTSYAALVHRVLEGRPELPRTTNVPRRIGRVLEQGLAVEPANRHPSMDVLLAELQRDPSRTWRRLGVLVAVAGFASAATLLGLGRGEPHPVDACSEVSHPMQRTWNEARRQQVEAALERAVPAGERIAQTTTKLLDEFARDWIDVATQTCAAMLVPGRGADATVVTREACLDMRRVELDALVGMLATADAALTLEAAQAAATLSSVQGCADPRRLQGWRAPADPEARERLARVRAELATAKARGLIGRYDDAVALAQSVIDAARELDDPSTEAAGLLVRGQHEERGGKASAEHTLREAARRAEVAGDHATRAHALIHLVWIVGAEAKRHDEARALAAEARAVLKVLGGAAIIEARLDNNLGVAAKVAKDYAAAVEAYQRALETQVELFGEEHPETARTLANLGAALGARGQHLEAEAMLRRALASFEAVLGDQHPLVATVVGNLGQNLDRQKRTREAVPLLERSLAIREAHFEPGHPAIVRAHYNLGIVLKAAGEHTRAVEHFERGLELRTRTIDDDDPSLHPWWGMLGVCKLELGRVDEASVWLERALDVRRDEPEHETAWLRFELARSLAESDPDRARTMAEGAAAALETRAAVDPAADGSKLAQIRAWLEAHSGSRQ